MIQRYTYIVQNNYSIVLRVTLILISTPGEYTYFSRLSSLASLALGTFVASPNYFKRYIFYSKFLERLYVFYRCFYTEGKFNSEEVELICHSKIVVDREIKRQMERQIDREIERERQVTPFLPDSRGHEGYVYFQAESVGRKLAQGFRYTSFRL